MRHPTSLCSADTIYSADSIEFKPSSSSSTSTEYGDDLSSRVFVCGTYQVDKLPNTETGLGDGSGDEDTSTSPAIRRKGKAIVYLVNESMDGFSHIQEFPTPAILDMRWSTPGAPGPSRLAIANAVGQVTLHRWQESYSSSSSSFSVVGAGRHEGEGEDASSGAGATSTSTSPGKVAGKFATDEDVDQEGNETIQVTDKDNGVLVLSLDWSSQLDPSSSTSLITSLSSGHLSYLTPDSTGALIVHDSWTAHDHEPWITAWDKWAGRGGSVVWSGGDDLKLKRWDVRESNEGGSGMVVGKCFEGGVTTIASSPHDEHLLAVGSYDENLRLFDTRNAFRPLRTLPVGGGIWRTKWHPSSARRNQLLLACMHGGAKTVEVDTSLAAGGGDDGCRIVAQFDGHGEGAIAYGADWSRLEVQDEGTDGEASKTSESVVATCSFYDHTVHLWRA